MMMAGMSFRHGRLHHGMRWHGAKGRRPSIHSQEEEDIMQPNTRKLALVLSLGMALSACGGGDGSSAAPESSVTTKAAPANTSSSQATPSTAATTQDSAAAQNGASAQNAANAQDAAGTQNTTDTQNTAATQDTAGAATQNDAAASGTDNTTAAATPAATSTTDAIRTTDDGKNYEIRGDLLIQILLSHVPERGAANDPLLPWIDADESTEDPDKYKMTGPALLVDEDITPNADNADNAGDISSGLQSTRALSMAPSSKPNTT